MCVCLCYLESQKSQQKALNTHTSLCFDFPLEKLLLPPFHCILLLGCCASTPSSLQGSSLTNFLWSKSFVFYLKIERLYTQLLLLLSSIATPPYPTLTLLLWVSLPPPMLSSPQIERIAPTSTHLLPTSTLPMFACPLLLHSLMGEDNYKTFF